MYIYIYIYVYAGQLRRAASFRAGRRFDIHMLICIHIYIYIYIYICIYIEREREIMYIHILHSSVNLCLTKLLIVCLTNFRFGTYDER